MGLIETLGIMTLGKSMVNIMDHFVILGIMTLG